MMMTMMTKKMIMLMMKKMVTVMTDDVVNLLCDEQNDRITIILVSEFYTRPAIWVGVS